MAVDLKEHVESRGTSGIDLWQWSDGHNSVNIYVHQVKASVFEELAKILGAEVKQGTMHNNESATWIDLKVGEVEVSVFKE